jgi:carboxyl-terminal processing protease
MTQEFTGIGVEISKPTGKLTIGGLLPDAPAYNTTSIDAGDVIEKIDGEPVTKDMSLNCAISKITGPRGTKVVLTIRHEGSKETEDITIVRDKIVVPTVKGWLRTSDGKWRYLLDESNGLAYLRITNFTATTAPDMETILIGLERKGLNGLIIDLRFNTGGYLETAAAIVDMFIKSGPIVKSRQRWSVSSNQERAHSTGTHPNYPVVVLINGSSASASEIVAGALQDKRYKRATLVGSRTYGKGSVQVITPATGSGSQLKYTTAHYHLPSEQRVKNRYVMEKLGNKDWGIAADVKIKLTGSEIQKMIDVRRDNETLARAGTNNKADSKKHTAKETIDADPQIAVGLLVLKTKMIQSGKLLQAQTANNAVAATKTDSKL